jgi:xanthine dehydrogenase accessory factor
MLAGLTVGIKGAGEMASGIAHCLRSSNFTRIFMMEAPNPLAVRRRVCFCSAITERETTVEGVTAVAVETLAGVQRAWDEEKIPVIIDPAWQMIQKVRPDVVIDAILAKKNLGTTRTEANLVIGLGPGFIAGKEVHVVIETNRGHDLGGLIFSGTAAENTGIPGEIGGYAAERVLRSPAGGCFIAEKVIGDYILPEEHIGSVAGREVVATIGGIIRGLILSGTYVTERLKIGDIDPRGRIDYCYTISDKARAIGGAVLTAILREYNL